ncbi:hypothetical protein G1H11_16300 [Phytoactinopolyspora alkaliphila]|uniref:Schlafen AlbA-2 domain-containing protein n=1 Tax=Phytoactinopolyspora alkaliphila TaxID=1783498 RepID=A0A6N9YPW5_9ACTN|nr:RNA-binding domain-containing protein [Phytoactinopolyspora alkaliphila]NED96869.1 hypothetical protein [Phytoactinopolyspora alkaliphila]
MITWSSLHRLLGLTPQPLTRAHIDQAVHESVAETSDLDWKPLPGRTDQERHEFAKDVAAMANSGGGLLVFGVGEDGGGRASSVPGVEIGEDVERRLRALAAGRIQPPVAGLQFASLSNDGDQARGVLVLAVPASADAPHMLERDGGILLAPYRDGPETPWMRERQLERAYRDRFAQRANELGELGRLAAEVSDQLELDVGAWLVGVARPRIPRAGILPDIVQTEVREIVIEGKSRSVDIAPARPGTGRFLILDELYDEALNPRRGLRRWVVRSASDTSPRGQSDGSYLEIHHDGTIAFATRLDWGTAAVEGHYVVPAELAESYVSDLIGLAHVSAQRRSVDGPMAVHLDIVKPDPATPLAIVTRYSTGSRPGQVEQEAPWARPVRKFTPLTSEISPGVDTEALRDTARNLAQDVVHQFGHDPLRIIPPASS